MATSSTISTNHDRIHVYIDGEVHDELCRRLRPGQTMDELIDELVSDEGKWLEIRDRIQNRTPVVDDLYEDDVDVDIPVLTPGAPAKKARCSCCEKACRCPFPWRGTVRCGCTPERLEFLRQSGGSYLK